MDIDKIKRELPNLNIVALNDGTGCNIHLPGKLIMTIFFKRKLFKTNKKKTKFRHFTDDADLLHLVCSFGNIQLKKSTGTALTQAEAIPNNGAKQCIDHVINKLKVVEKNDPGNTKGILMLKILAQEFEQYL